MILGFMMLIYPRGFAQSQNCQVDIQSKPSQGGIILEATSDGIAPFIYRWNSGQRSSVIFAADPGEYCVTITDSMGCTARACYRVSLDSCFVMLTDSSNLTGNIYAYPFGQEPFQYEWNTGDTTEFISIDQSGTYCVTVTDNNGCISSKCIESIIDSCIVQIQKIRSNSGYFLYPDYRGLTGVAPYSYSWSTGDTTERIQVEQEGNYCLTITDAAGCTAVDCIRITRDSCEIILNLQSIQRDSILFITAEARMGREPYQYNWSNGSTNRTIRVAQSGTYCVTVTDAQGCQTRGCDDFFTENCSVSLITEDANTGKVVKALAGGIAPFTYMWSTRQTGPEIIVRTSDLYCVTITDTNGCEADTCIRVDVENEPDSCGVFIREVRTNTGELLEAVANGSRPFSYIWSNGDSSAFTSPGNAGTYCVTITDANGCQAEACYRWNEADSCSVSIQTTSTRVGDFLVAQSTGIAPFRYHWSNGDTSRHVVITQAGTYCVTVVDATGCQAEDCYTTSYDSCAVSIRECTDTNEGLIAYSRGTAPFSYRWSTGDTTQKISVDMDGTYCVTITDANGCEARACIDIDGNMGRERIVHGSVILDSLFTPGEIVRMGPTIVSLYLLEANGLSLVEEQELTGMRNTGIRSFSFEDLADGTYLLRAAQSNNTPLAELLAPTYHLSSLFWSDAEQIQIPQTNSQASNIYPLRNPRLSGGNGLIRGNVIETDGLLEDTDRMSRNESDPAAGATILLFDAFGSLRHVDRSLIDGSFLFENIPYGRYELTIDVPGYERNSIWIDLGPDNQKEEGLLFEIEKDGISTSVRELDEKNLKVYPNPVISSLLFDWSSSTLERQHLVIINATGQRFFSTSVNTGKKRISVDVSNWPAGSYFYRIQSAEKVHTGKFVKIHH